MEEFGKQERISDEEFIKNYSKHHNHENRSDKYTKENDKKATSNMKFYFFLGISFLVAYYLFSTYYFVPKI